MGDWACVPHRRLGDAGTVPVWDAGDFRAMANETREDQTNVRAQPTTASAPHEHSTPYRRRSARISWPIGEQRGKLMLLDLGELATWLAEVTVHRQIRLIQNHHTYLPSYRHFNGSNHFEQLTAMESAHLERGFSEIAQNLTIFPDGRVAICRPLDKIPAGAKGANTGGICIENLGNFDVLRDEMSPVQRDSIVQVNALLCRKFALTPSTDTIVYHHWYDRDTGARVNGSGNTKSCPGTAFFGGNSVAAAHANFIPLVHEALAALPASSTPLPDPLFAGRVIADSSLNVRLQPRAWARKVGQLHKGVVVSVFATHGVWCRVHPTETRWVNGKFLERL
jgi:hypothetical protein